jgi:hypothetical protein
MNTKTNQKTIRILNLLLLLALLVPMLACGASQQNKAVNRPAPTDTLTEEKPKDTPTPTATNPLEAIYGSWEVNYGGPKGVEKWNFKRATEKDGDYVGKITDANNVDIYTYTIKPQPNNPSSGTIGLVGLNQMNLVGQGKTLDYEVTDNGNKIILKDNPEVVLKRDSGSADIQAFAEKIKSLGPWRLNFEAAKDLGFSGDTFVIFDTAQKYSNGYGGNMEISDSSKVVNYNYIITSKNEISLKDNVGEKKATYQFDNNVLTIKYKDEPGGMTLTR